MRLLSVKAYVVSIQRVPLNNQVEHGSRDTSGMTSFSE